MEQEMSGAQYHPRMEHLFITSDCKGNVLLWDARMAFTKKDDEGVVQKVSLLGLICPYRD